MKALLQLWLFFSSLYLFYQILFSPRSESVEVNTQKERHFEGFHSNFEQVPSEGIYEKTPQSFLSTSYLTSGNFIPGSIPKKLHQTWKTKELPIKFGRWSRYCKELHPESDGWTYKLWDDQDNLEFVKEHFPWFLDTFERLPYAMSKVDAIRYMVLYIVFYFLI